MSTAALRRFAVPSPEELIDRALDALGAGIASAVNVLDVEAIANVALHQFYGGCDVVLSPSPATDARLRALRIAERRINRWDRGVDLERFDAALRTPGLLPAGTTNVLYAGRLTKEKGVELLAEAPGWFTYDLPSELVPHAWGGRYRGQKQKWYALRFTGKDSEIDITNPGGGHDPEFIDWRWEPMANLPDLVVPFKRKTYERVVRAFTKFAKRS